jgi:lipoprotein signal peptidase
MTRLIAIAVLIVLAMLLLRYRTNQKVQKGVVLTIVGGAVFYIISVFVVELLR